jgi:hypothetical protein
MGRKDHVDVLKPVVRAEFEEAQKRRTGVDNCAAFLPAKKVTSTPDIEQGGSVRVPSPQDAQFVQPLRSAPCEDVRSLGDLQRFGDVSSEGC